MRSKISSLAGYLTPINRPLSTVMPLGRRVNDEFQHSYGNKVKVAIHQSSRAKTMVRCMDWATLYRYIAAPFPVGLFVDVNWLEKMAAALSAFLQSVKAYSIWRPSYFNKHLLQIVLICI